MITNNGAQFDKQAFDFIIAGGGTAGLALAARLSEDESVTVLVLEAGGDTIGDPKVAIPGQFGVTLGDTKYDWQFNTTPQKHLNDRIIRWARGKGLGGTSAVNFYCWVRPSVADIDNIEKLGNPGWGWESFYPYLRKCEKFTPPDEEQAKTYPYTYDTKLRGSTGPIQFTIAPHVKAIDELYTQTVMKLGARQLYDAYGGDNNGTFICSANLDRKTWTRSYSASAYLLPAKDRSNLTVVTGAFVSRALFSDQRVGDDLVASGVEFLQNGQTFTVQAKKEVILCAGIVKSPHILELSGVGSEKVLGKLGIETKVNLPGVGENVQDHILSGVSYELRPEGGYQTLDLMKNPEFAAAQVKLYPQGKGMLLTSVTGLSYLPVSTLNPEGFDNYISAAEKQVAEIKALPDLPPGLADQLDIQLEIIRDASVPDTEIVAFPGLFSNNVQSEPGKTYLSLICAPQRPLSRGSVHATSTNPLDSPALDPRYNERSFDTELFLESIKFLRRAAALDPLKSAITGVELEPGAKYETDDQLRAWINEHYTSSWHAVGSCSMLPREKNGVLSPELKVYGTTNLRVVDLSVVPLQIASHPQSVVYAIAEKAADIIRAEHKLKGGS